MVPNTLFKTTQITALFLLVVLTLFAGYFRIYNLGYSNFQGDEVSAQNYLFDHQSFTQFLFTRNIPPGQYIITYITNLISNPKIISNELLLRIPFTTFAILFLLISTYSVRLIFNNQTALIYLGFVGLNGLLIAFSKFTQYQSVILFLSSLNLLFIYKFFSFKKSFDIYLLGLIGGLAMLFHYDALSFILPTVIILITFDYKNFTNFKNLLTFKYLLILGGTIGLYYVPYIIYSPNIITTLNYLVFERIYSNNVSQRYDTSYYSLLILSIYNSKEYLFLTFTGLAFVFYKLSKNNLIYLLVFIKIVVVYNNVYLTTALCFLLALITFNTLIKVQNEYIHSFITIWFLITFTTYFILLKQPLTHIYCFFIPMYILIANYLNSFLITQNGILKHALILIMFITFLGQTSFLYQAFINITPEYPWNIKTYIFGQMPTQLANKTLIKGVFGFPYNRDLEKLNEINKAYAGKNYVSNEKDRLLKYYLPNLKFNAKDPNIFIDVINSQSLSQQQYCTENNKTLWQSPNLKVCTNIAITTN